MPEHCLFCGAPIELERIVNWGAFCSKSCHDRQQKAIKRLRDTSPPEALEPVTP